MALTSSEQQVLAQASQLLERGDLAGAENVLLPRLSVNPSPRLLSMTGLLRLLQKRHREAEELFASAAAAEPKDALHALYLGRACAAQDKIREASIAYRMAIKLNPRLTAAYFELAASQRLAGWLEEAESTYRKLLRVAPDSIQAKSMLAAVLTELGRPDDAAILLRRALDDAGDDKSQTDLRSSLALALRRRNNHEEALTEIEAVRRLSPPNPALEIQRADILQDLRRYDEALAVFRAALVRDPRDPQLHQAFNNLLYRLGRTDDFLASYDRVPGSRDLMLDKAAFLAMDKRHAEAFEVYNGILRQNSRDPVAAARAARMLSLQGLHAQAAEAFNAALELHSQNEDVRLNAAEAALRAGDAQTSVALYHGVLQGSPHNHFALSGLGVGLRLLGDERDENLNGYDTLIQVFDLEPPEGFSSMAQFNAELETYLDGLHPPTGEYISQSVRGGTQTSAQLFGTGQALVQALQNRVDEAVVRYISALRDDDAHPFLSRRTDRFHYARSWSSRLRDCGYHVNHIHPGGWISSCYYVGVPQAAEDETARQGWIKFGEPSFATALANPIRRAVQPVPGRLVLFPSYMWHGTIPFHDAQQRTTVAFDILPCLSR